MNIPRRSAGLLRIGRTVAIVALSLAFIQDVKAQEYKTTWVGNTFGGEPNGEHVQNNISAMAVGADGTIFTDSGWDEGGWESGIYKAAAGLGACGDLHGWGRSGNTAVATDGTYVYVAMTQNGDNGANSNNNSNGLPQYPPAGTQWYCVRRYLTNGNSASFSTGYGWDGAMLKINTATNSGGYPDLTIHGLAVANGKLYASDPANGVIHVYNTSNLSVAASWTCARCQALAVDSGGNVWVCQSASGGTGAQIAKFNSSGTLQAQTITFASSVTPTALAYQSSKNYLYVADNGPDQNVKIYNLGGLSGSPTAATSTLGTVGGIFAGSGATIGTAGPLRFNQPSGVGVDSSGNIYVSSTGGTSGGGSVLECYTAAGSRSWVLYGLEFVDTAEPDPASDADVFTKEEHFTMNYANAGAGAEWSYKGYTVNPFKYPNDPRNHFAMVVSWVREIGGHKFLFTSDMYATYLAVNRFNSSTDGEIAIPSGLFVKSNAGSWPANQPATGEWIWRDSNGNGTQDSGEYASTGSNSPISGWGWWVDSKGDVWECSSAGLRHFICQGLDSVGNPIYDYASGHVVNLGKPPLPSGVSWNDILRVRYYPTQANEIPADTMFVSGYTTQWSDNTGGWWGTAGRVVYRYDNWSSTPTTHAGYPIVLPSDTTVSPETVIQGVDVCGKYLFAGRSRNPQTITIYDNNTGLQVGTMEPGPAVGSGNTGWLDIREPVHVYKRSSNEYLVFVEEDDKGKVLLYRWIPFFEAESLAIEAFSGPDTRVISDPGFSNGEAVILDANAVGNYMTFVVPSVNQQPYDVRVGVKTFSSRGIWQLAISKAGTTGPTNVGSPQDDYAGGAAFVEHDCGNWAPGSSSDKWFWFTITGKNASSSGYSDCIDYISLIPQ